MNVAIRVTPTNGHFTARVLGDPSLCATAATRDATVEALQQEIQIMFNRGELLSFEIATQGLMALFGKYRDDPTLEDICRQAYAERDAEK